MNCSFEIKRGLKRIIVFNVIVYIVWYFKIYFSVPQEQFNLNTLNQLQKGMTVFDALIKGLDLLTITIPPALPAAMTVGKLHALNRLKKQKISCINSRVINVSGSLNCICFDKVCFFLNTIICLFKSEKSSQVEILHL